MDTELARTFLTIVAAGNFISAAERLHVTQSTVSARIRALEDQLGCTLFVRNKAGTTLTPAGRQFQKHAGTLVRTIEQARHDVGVPQGFRAALAIGGLLLIRYRREPTDNEPHPEYSEGRRRIVDLIIIAIGVAAVAYNILASQGAQ